jgi:hypothetical protein
MSKIDFGRRSAPIGRDVATEGDAAMEADVIQSRADSRAFTSDALTP